MAIQKQVEAVREEMLDAINEHHIICGIGMIVGGVAAICANEALFGGDNWIAAASLNVIETGTIILLGLLSTDILFQ